MSSIEEKYRKASEALAAAEKAANTATGEHNAVMKQLEEEFGCGTVAEAEKKLEAFEKKLATTETKLETALTKFEDDYGEQIRGLAGDVD